MRSIPTDLPEVLILEPKLFEDERGSFMESHSRRKFTDLIGRDLEVVQDNDSRSSRGVLRGMHYQLSPSPQGKLMRVVQGEIFDVAVDVRRSSPNYGKWTGVHPTAENKRQLWVPQGFAHGFLTISEAEEALYKTTDYYAPACEAVIAWNDPELAISWPMIRWPHACRERYFGASSIGR